MTYTLHTDKGITTQTTSSKYMWQSKRIEIIANVPADYHVRVPQVYEYFREFLYALEFLRSRHRKREHIYFRELKLPVTQKCFANVFIT